MFLPEMENAKKHTNMARNVYMALHRFKPTNYHHQFETMVQYYMFNAYLNAHSCHYEDVIVAMKVKEYVPKLSSYMDKLAMAEMYN